MDNFIKKIPKIKINKYLIIGIILFMMFITGSTYAYLSSTASNSSITGNMGEIDLKLTVTKVLPDTNEVDDIIIVSIDELASSLNDECMDNYGEYTLCQLYKVNLTNSVTGLSTRVKGSIAFNNESTPNLSWMLIENYDANNTYNSETLGNNFHTSSSTFTNFEDSYLLSPGTEVDYYILVWVNETEELQTDEGSYSGTIKFEDVNGNGLTATFNS